MPVVLAMTSGMQGVAHANRLAREELDAHVLATLRAGGEMHILGLLEVVHWRFRKRSKVEGALTRLERSGEVVGETRDAGERRRRFFRAAGAAP